jgi:hypothetical protein
MNTSGSTRFQFNQKDLKAVMRNAVIFAAPALLFFLTTIQAGGSLESALIALKLWAMNTAIDGLRKFITNNSSSL